MTGEGGKFQEDLVALNGVLAAQLGSTTRKVPVRKEGQVRGVEA